VLVQRRPTSAVLRYRSDACNSAHGAAPVLRAAAQVTRIGVAVKARRFQARLGLPQAADYALSENILPAVCSTAALGCEPLQRPIKPADTAEGGCATCFRTRPRILSLAATKPPPPAPPRNLS